MDRWLSTARQMWFYQSPKMFKAVKRMEYAVMLLSWRPPRILGTALRNIRVSDVTCPHSQLWLKMYLTQMQNEQIPCSKPWWSWQCCISDRWFPLNTAESMALSAFLARVTADSLKAVDWALFWSREKNAQALKDYHQGKKRGWPVPVGLRPKIPCTLQLLV